MAVLTTHDRVAVYVCPKCGARVRAHGRTHVPQGLPCLPATGKLRRQGHILFDRLWTVGVAGDRNRAYRWLARELGIRRDDCHFGHFDKATAERAIVILQAEMRRASVTGKG